jgi:hypothetical protein
MIISKSSVNTTALVFIRMNIYSTQPDPTTRRRTGKAAAPEGARRKALTMRVGQPRRWRPSEPAAPLAELERIYKADWYERPEVSRRQMVLGLFTDVAHHRGQAEVYMRAIGNEPPTTASEWRRHRRTGAGRRKGTSRIRLRRNTGRRLPPSGKTSRSQYAFKSPLGAILRRGSRNHCSRVTVSHLGLIPLGGRETCDPFPLA